jgi:glycosyltransferase involved in cell wall biosynthesis
MRVAIVVHHDFRSNSGIHVFNLANRLVRLGVDVTAYVPGDPRSVETLGRPSFEVRKTSKLGRRPFDVVHAWTPRQEVRAPAEALQVRHGARLVVHLEDNEDVVAAHGAGVASIADLPESSLFRYENFLARADGITAVIDRLLEFAPAAVPRVVIWPGYEPELFHPLEPDNSLRRELGISCEKVVVYAGNTHGINVEEVRTLYDAVRLVNERGTRLRLVRLGVDWVDFEPSPYEVRIPYVSRAEVPRYYALADVLVQPGRPGAFNDYRFPSKLPEFLAMGKPVVLPAANIGLELVEGEEALLLRSGGLVELADAVERVLSDPALTERLSAGGRRFAETRLSWDACAEALAKLYADVARR